MNADIVPQMDPETQRAILGASVVVAPGGTGWSYVRSQLERPLIVLMAVVAVVLLIACANVANLLLARAAAREREMAIRCAIGAGRQRLVRQLLTESVLLATLGAALGALLALVGSRVLMALLAADSGNTIVLNLRPDLRVLAFTSSVAIATGLLFGLVPALRASAARPGSIMKEAARTFTHVRARLASALVVVQVALSLLLLIGAGLFVRTLRNLERVDAGFASDGVLLVSADPRAQPGGKAPVALAYREFVAALGTVPGVRTATLSTSTPLGGGHWTQGFSIDGQLPDARGKEEAELTAVAPGFFDTMGIAIRLGRDFALGDDVHGAPVVIINEILARERFGSANPIGHRLSVSGLTSLRDAEIIGVVKGVSSYGLRQPPGPALYLSYYQIPEEHLVRIGAVVELRVERGLAAVAEVVRERARALAPNSPVRVSEFARLVDNSLLRERMLATLASFFGLLALGLSAVGLYGLMAFTVARRTSEIGIRMALGARRQEVQWLVLGQTLRLLVTGIVLGLPAVWIASRSIRAMLYGVEANDEMTMFGAALLIGIIALVAGYLPARRASRVDPMVALRYE